MNQRHKLLWKIFSENLRCQRNDYRRERFVFVYEAHTHGFQSIKIRTTLK